MVVPASTTRLRKGEFVDYLMRIEAEAAGMGIRIPTPDEYFHEINQKSQEKVAKFAEEHNIPKYEEDPNYQPDNVKF